MQQIMAFSDDLRSPLHVLPGLLNDYNGSNPAQVLSSVSAWFSSKFGGSPDMLQQVPVLTHDTAEAIPPNSLVRFRGMVTDMFNPEFFLGAYKASGDGPWKPAALYTDVVPDDIDAAADTRIMERRPLLVSPVPQEQPWATAAWAGHPVEPPTPSATDRIKRAREPSDLPGPALARGSTPAAAADKAEDSAAAKAPRIASSSDVDAAYVEADAHPSGITHDQDQTRQQQQQPGQQGTAEVDEHQQQRPTFLPGDCIVQVYSHFDGFQLHDVVEVLGVMSVVPGLAALQQHGRDADQQHQQGRHGGNDAVAADDAGAAGAAADGMDVDDGFWQNEVAALPPTSQVMRLHALVIRKLPVLTPAIGGALNAAQQAAAGQPWPRSVPGHLSAQLPLLRERALSLLAAPLAGDVLAAEYLLLAALGSVVNREDMGGAMGLLPINITQVPSSSSSSKAAQLVPGLAAALRSLLPHVALLPLNLTALNNKRWYPQQCPVTGRLFRGALQLTAGTLLLLDETGMGAGELGDAGVKNLQALRQVLVRQQLPCGCQVYTHNLNVNQPVVVLSGGRSVLRDSLALMLPLQPQRPVLVKPGQTSSQTVGLSAAEPGAPAAAVVDWDAADVLGPDAVAAAAASMPELAAVRDYLAAARVLECRMDQSSAEACVARFRALQQANPGVGMEDLNTIITLSKLLSASMGHEVFSTDSWERAVQLEQLRKQRLAATAPPQQ